MKRVFVIFALTLQFVSICRSETVFNCKATCTRTAISGSEKCDKEKGSQPRLEQGPWYVRCVDAKQAEERSCEKVCEDRSRSAKAQKCPNGITAVNNEILSEKRKCREKNAKEEDRKLCSVAVDEKLLPNFRACNGEI
jgi:hypothetical protein